MTLLDAPKFDEVRYRYRQRVIYLSVSIVVLLLFTWWLVAGHPVDWPWHWDAYIFGRSAVNRFLTAVEKKDLNKAYGIWMHDPNWQQHPQRYSAYPFNRFEEDWAPNAQGNEYGVIQSHQIAAARVYGNMLLVAVLINGRKSDALNLAYDPRHHVINFSPPGVQLYLGP